MTFAQIAEISGFITAIAAAVALFVKPVRMKLFGLNDIFEGQKCLLRSQMLSIYYKGKESDDKVRQYDFENFVLLYAAYKAEHGNSFIDKIKDEVYNMEVIK